MKAKFSEEPGNCPLGYLRRSATREFVDELHRVLEENLANARFSVDDLAAQMNVGRTVFIKGERSYGLLSQ